MERKPISLFVQNSSRASSSETDEKKPVDWVEQVTFGLGGSGGNTLVPPSPHAAAGPGPRGGLRASASRSAGGSRRRASRRCFGGLVLGCIGVVPNTHFSAFSRSTKCAFLCTARILNFSKICEMFLANFRKFRKILFKFMKIL